MCIMSMKKIIKFLDKKVFISETLIKDNYSYGLVFGGVSMDYRICNAINLYKQKVINKIIISGNHPILKKNNISECDYMLDILLKNNILINDIIKEDKSITTYQNIKNSLININKNDSVLLISSDFHVKRIISIMKRMNVWFNYDAYHVKDGITDKDNWYLTSKGRKIIILEFIKSFISIV